jgi:hypothetical protein
MERTARRIIGAAALEFHVAVYDLDDIDAAEQVLDERLRNHACGGCSIAELRPVAGPGKSTNYRIARSDGAGIGDRAPGWKLLQQKQQAMISSAAL